MKTKIMILIALIFNTGLYFPQISDSNKPSADKSFPPIALVNSIKFIESKFDNPLDGCAFLLDTGKDTLAVTCKHALWAAKTDSMKYVHFEGGLKEWRMHRKDDTTKYLITGLLLNENRDELIGEINVDSDYLVFKIKENHTGVKPVQLRKTEIRQGEDIFLVGWTFADKVGAQRVYKTKYYKAINNHILLETGAYKNMAGISGGAVLDKDGLLVGIVSNYTFDEETKKWYYSPCSTEYLNKIIEKLTHD